MIRVTSSIAVILCAVALPGCDLPAPTPMDLAARLEPLRAEHDVPSLAGAVADSETLIALGATGYRRRDQDIPVTRRDRYHLGSCTKAMTATLVALLVDEGKLDWDLTLAEALPDVAVDPGFAGVTIAHLLAHRGGIHVAPDADPGIDLNDPLPVQRRRVAEWLLTAPPGGTPGEFDYSNEGYVLAGAILEAHTGRSWEDLMRERLFAPLGMTSCGFGAPGTPGKTDQPWGHQGQTPVPPGPLADNPPVIGPAGTVHCSLADWSRFARVHLAGERGESDFVSADSFHRMHTPWPGDGPLRYALGWALVDLPAGPALLHDGSNTLWYSFMALLPSQDLAVLTATNAGDEAAAEATKAALLALSEEFAQ